MFKMTRLTLFIIFSFFIYMAPVYSSEFELPNKVDVALVPNVTYSSNDSCFIYEYTAVSSNSSVQEVCNLFFPTTELCSNVESPSGWSGDFAQKVHRTWPESKMVIWFASWANDDPRGRIIPNHGNIEPSPNQIKPGQSLNGFSFKSQSCPGIVSFYAEGFTKLPEFPEGMAEDLATTEGPLDNSFQGKTVGPVILAITSTIGLLDRLIFLKDSMPDYGWITNNGIINSLNVKLRAAKESLQKDKKETAANQLKAFINELNAQKGKHINENAWVLLRANAEFIIAKLEI